MDNAKPKDQPRLFRLQQSDRKEAIEKLINESSPTADFFLLLVLSAFIVVPALYMNSSAVIIGGMVVAPLLSPILSLGMGIVLADFHLISRALRTMSIAVVLVIICALIMSLFNPERILNNEITSRSGVTIAHLIIAIASGIAASFALAKPNVSAAITGIAISVSLLPPLAVAGIGVSLLDFDLTIGALSLFFVNLLGIVTASTIVFSLLGFYPLRKQAAVQLEKEEQEMEEERNHE